jgi:hypothetical protein
MRGNNLATVLKSRVVALWLLVAAFCLAWMELGHLAGIVPRSVLEGLSGGVSLWWELPAALHVVALVGVGWLVWMTGRNLLKDVTPPRSLWGRLLVGAVVLLGIFLCLNQFVELENVITKVTDFGTIHQGSAALLTGGDPYTATDQAYFYPPLLAFLFGPLTLLPLAAANLLFFSLKFVLVVWTLAACDRLVQGNQFTGGRRVLFLFGLIFVASRFWIADLQYGNTNLLILFLVTGAIVWDRADRPLAAGLALALAVSIKIVPVVLCLHFLILGRWRTLAYFTAGLVGFNFVPWFFLQDHWRDTWAAYLDNGVEGKLNQRLAQPDNQSLWGVVGRMFPATPLADLRLVWFGCGSLLGVFAGLVSWSARRREPLVQVAAAALYPLVGLLVSPGSWVVHYTAVLLPMSMLWMLTLSGRWPARWAWVLFGITNIAFTVSGWARTTVHASITQSWFVVAAVLLMAGLGAWALTWHRGGGDQGETC